MTVRKQPESSTAPAFASAAGLVGQEPAKARQVHRWNPPYCGELDMRIARDGTWFYLGTPIGRKPLVRLFSSILRREGERYYLVTPVEKVGIVVDDAPFVAVDLAVEGAGEAQRITFTTQVEDVVTAGPEHPIRLARNPRTGEPAPYVHVRAGLEALIDRKSFYRLVELGCEREGQFGVWSDGAFFAFQPAAELDAG